MINWKVIVDNFRFFVCLLEELAWENVKCLQKKNQEWISSVSPPEGKLKFPVLQFSLLLWVCQLTLSLIHSIALYTARVRSGLKSEKCLLHDVRIDIIIPHLFIFLCSILLFIHVRFFFLIIYSPSGLHKRRMSNSHTRQHEIPLFWSYTRTLSALESVECSRRGTDKAPIDSPEPDPSVESLGTSTSHTICREREGEDGNVINHRLESLLNA